MDKSNLEFYGRMLELAVSTNAPQSVVVDIRQRMERSSAVSIQNIEARQGSTETNLDSSEKQYVQLQKRLVQALREDWPHAEIRRLVLACQSVHNPILARRSA